MSTSEDKTANEPQKTPYIVVWEKSIKEKFKNFWGWISCHQHEIMLILTVIATASAAFSAYYSLVAIKEARDSSKLAEQNLNKTTEIAKWYYEPQPQMNLWSSVDYELKEFGVVYIDEWFDYIHGKGGFDIINGTLLSGYIKFGNNSRFYSAPSYLSCCKNINIFIYNSGRGSIVFPLMSFELKAKNKTKGVIFKVHTIRTPIDKLEYDPIKKYMFESQEFIENQQIWMPYGNKGDFPPYPDENGNSYFVPPAFSEKYTTKYSSMSLDKRSDVLGPFNIGTIPPGGTAEIDLKIFATESDCTEGFLNITIQALNTNTSKNVSLKTGDKETCKRKEENTLMFLSMIFNWHKIAVDYFNSGNYTEALMHSQDAIREYEDLKQQEASANLIKEKITPENEGKLYRLGSILAQKLGKNELAYEYARKTLDADPSPINNAYWASVLYDSGKYQEALEYIEKALQVEPNNSEFLKLKKTILLKTN